MFKRAIRSIIGFPEDGQSDTDEGSDGKQQSKSGCKWISPIGPYQRDGESENRQSDHHLTDGDCKVVTCQLTLAPTSETEEESSEEDGLGVCNAQDERPASCAHSVVPGWIRVRILGCLVIGFVSEAREGAAKLPVYIYD